MDDVCRSAEPVIPALFICNMKRRLFIGTLVSGALAAAVAGPANAPTPYRQWTVLRQRFLLVHSNRTDPVSDAIADQIVVILV